MEQRRNKWLPDNFPPFRGAGAEPAPQAGSAPLRLAVVIHAFYPELLDPYVAGLRHLPQPFDLYVTAPQEKIDAAVARLAADFGRERVIALPSANRGRDIAPFLIEAGPHLSGYDLVCKLHTKKSSHAQYGRDWARGLLASLLGSPERTAQIVRDFCTDPALGVLCPALSVLQIWGYNLPGAQILAQRLGLPAPDLPMHVFCAGSMFWFRPAALRPLLAHGWRYEDFPPEAGQEDGTTAHIIERLILSAAVQGGFRWSELPPDAESVDIAAHWSHMMARWPTLVDYHRELGVRARAELAACRELPPQAREGAASALPEVPALPLPQEGDAGEDKPFFSVMIPVYNPPERYLREAVASVVAALPAELAVQVEVVDDGAGAADVRRIVEECGQGRVGYHRNERNLGLLGNWHECIRHARGEWVHILHQDDVVRPDFYRALHRGLCAHPEAGMGFCRPSHIDENSRVIFEYWKEAEAPGLLNNWLISLARRLGVQFACVVVRRSVYAALGGFCAQADHASDWEMWIRIAAHYPVYYHPEILAAFRVHNQSASGRASAACKNIDDTRAAIEIVARYLPREYRHWLRHAREYYGNSALRQGQAFLQAGDASGAAENARAGLRLQPSQELAGKLQQVIAAAEGRGQAVAAPSAPAPAPVPAGIGDGLDKTALAGLCQRLAADGADDALLQALRQWRQGVAQRLIGCPGGALSAALLQTPLGDCLLQLLNAGLTGEDLLPEEAAAVEELQRRSIDPGVAPLARMPYYLALMLYCPAHRLAAPPERLPLVMEFHQLVLRHWLAVPAIFRQPGEAAAFAAHLERVGGFLCGLCDACPDDPLTLAAVRLFAEQANFINAYFNDRNQKQLYRNRARLLRFFLLRQGHPLDGPLASPEEGGPESRRLRVGFLNAHFGRQTETYTSLPFFEHLDARQFEVILLSLNPLKGALAEYCSARAARTVILPGNDLAAAAREIRQWRLDLIVIGTNTTAVSNPVALLACYRLARVQLFSFSSPISTGFPCADYYFTGTLLGQEQRAHHSERLLSLAGPGFCFSYTADALPDHPAFTRAQFQLPENAPLLISAANYYKLIPEVRQAWARLLAQNPQAVLVLVPFNAAWSNRYPERLFLRVLHQELAAAGARPEQLRVLPALPDRNALVRLIALCDLYLDSFPYSGANSIVDPLEAGVPPICIAGQTMRTGQGMAILRSCGLDELVAGSLEEYMTLAHRLLNDRAYSAAVREKISGVMAGTPVFLDRVAFGAEVGKALLEAHRTGPLPPPEDLCDGRSAASSAPVGQSAPGLPAEPARTVRPNDPCPCGSNLKYKKCCGKG